MRAKKEQRSCIACRTKQNKALMIRANKNKDGMITLDEGKKHEGRGAYVCKNEQCIQKVIKAQSLNRVYKQQIDKGTYETLKKMEANIEQNRKTTRG